nr:aminoglycoside phosphotransferase family protein [Micromonospora sp. DSM 115978]
MPEPLPALVAAAAHTVARRLGFKTDEVQPLRVHDAATLLLPAEHLVLRLVPESQEAVARARRAVQLTGWLAMQDFPTIRPAADEPLETATYVVTVWHEVPAHPRGSPVAVNTALGRLLRELHTLPVPPVELPSADPLARVRAALHLDASRTEPVLSRDDFAFLHGRVEGLAQRYTEMQFPLGSGLIHNDAHPGNLLPDPSSRHDYRLADWEGACLGPRELDIVLVGAPGSRFGDPDHERLAFTAAYGYDIADWPDYQALRDIRDLHSLAAYIRTSIRTPAALTELRRRVASLRDDDRTIQWVAV